MIYFMVNKRMTIYKTNYFLTNIDNSTKIVLTPITLNDDISVLKIAVNSKRLPHPHEHPDRYRTYETASSSYS